MPVRIIIGLVVFIALWMLFALGYTVTPPQVRPPAPATSAPCPAPTPRPTRSTAAAPTGEGDTAADARPARGAPCPPVTTTLTVTAVPTRDTP
ncbi:hypothetical protein [Amycolatopsis sp. WAC 01376]|uniref:hypothetical protein n=1 Tax=Amycolatopsis sp. WAC 01376 TaxID=2203195 RepID=UPI001315527F|nr:hypothetical protein [Amycolatopsis sp. WAC 01376]